MGNQTTGIWLPSNYLAGKRKWNTIPLSVSAFDVLPHVPSDNGEKTIVLYCAALKTYMDANPRFIVSGDYTMYAHDAGSWRHPGYTQILATMPACVPMFPVASVRMISRD